LRSLEAGIIEAKKPRMDVLEEEKLFNISGEINTLLLEFIKSGEKNK
jgi:hypothetical protein